MENEQSDETIVVKVLKAQKNYGIKRGEFLRVRVLQREARYTIFLEPPIRQITLYNEDWKEIKDTSKQ